MSLPPSASSTGRPRRIIAAAGVVVLLSVPLAVLYGLIWSARSADHDFGTGERRGVRYLGPLTELISTMSGQQSAVVHGRLVDSTAVRKAVAAMDATDRELGPQLDSTERWTKLRTTVLSVAGRSFADPDDAFTAYSELLDSAVALVRKVGDTSKLILNPDLDAYYVMNATLLRIPDVIVDGGRYSDLVYLIVQRRQTNQVERIAQLSTARLDVAESAADLIDGLEKAFDETRSDTLGPAMLRELDNFRTAVDALAPRTAPTAAPSTRLDPTVIGNSQQDLQRTSLDLDRAALGQLDLLLSKRITAATRGLILGGAVAVLGVLLVWLGAVWLPARRRGAPPAAPPPPVRAPGSRHGDRRDAESVDARELVASSGLALPPRRGGTRAAR
jgi:hypothetical protein